MRFGQFERCNRQLELTLLRCPAVVVYVKCERGVKCDAASVVDKLTKMSVPNPPTTEEVRDNLYRAVGDRMAGYQLQQVHGQRKLFNPMLKKVFTPAEGSEVFIGRLPRDLFEDELVPPFLNIGLIYEMRLMMNFSGTNRGFAFVMFSDPETAVRAVRMLNNFEIRKGQQIGVLLSINNRRLYIGPLLESPNLVSIRDFINVCSQHFFSFWWF